MEGVMWVQKRAKISREKLLTAADELFREKGYFNTNTKEIVKRAGCSVGNFYNYFSNKGEVYCELVHGYINGTIMVVEHMIEQIEGKKREEAREIIRAFMKKQINRAIGYTNFFDPAVCIKEGIELESVIEEGEAKLIGLFVDYYKRQGRNTGAISYEIQARMLYVATNEIANDIMKLKEEDKKEEYMELLVEFILDYIYE